MSTTIVAPLPNGFGVSAVAEHRARREPDAHHGPDEEPETDEHQASQEHSEKPRSTIEAAPPAPDEPVVPAETLFAAALFANEMLRQHPSPDEIRLRNGHAWSPPESALRLKHKVI